MSIASTRATGAGDVRADRGEASQAAAVRGEAADVSATPIGACSPLAIRGATPAPTAEELAAVRQFQAIGLEELDHVRLLDRIDTKWFFHRSLVPQLIACLCGDYFILETAGTRIASYDSLYFDTPELSFYRQHHNKRKPRLKVRFRQYVESDLTFVEVKHKTNTGRSVKHRVPVSSIETELGPLGSELVSAETDLEPLRIVPTIRNTFARLTLVRNDYSERVTIDLGPAFVSATGNADLPDLAVVELKQSGRAASPVANVLADMDIPSSSLSKYCLGVAWTIPNAKRNNFKRLMRRLVRVELTAPASRRADVP
jgi:hypothetical protein